MNRYSNPDQTAQNSSATPRTDLNTSVNNTVALITGALQARQSWLADSNRWLASAAFEKGKSETATNLAETAINQVASSQQTSDKLLIPEPVMASLLVHVDAVCISFLSTFDEQADGVKYSDGEVDSACQALRAALTRPLARIVSLNGSLPSPALEQLFDSL